MTIKKCACGRSYTLHEWLELHFVGDMVDEEEHIELRDCFCRSTLGVVVLSVDEAGVRFYETM